MVPRATSEYQKLAWIVPLFFFSYFIIRSIY